MFLWWWALDYAQDGELTSFAPDELESVMAWEGESGTLYAALINCRIDDKHAGFLEKIGSRIFIHDWDEYAGKLIDRRKEDAERKRQERKSRSPISPEDIPDDVLQESIGCPQDVHTLSFVENSTQHNTTQQDTTQPYSDAPASEYAPDAQKSQSQKPKSRRAAVLSELEKEFSRFSGLPLPARKTASEKSAAAKRWWNPLWQIYDVTAGADLERAKSAMQATIVKMRKDGLTITAPQSIQNICAAMVAGGNGKGPRGAVIHLATPADVDAEFARLNPKAVKR
jgi:hypothetical protein